MGTRGSVGFIINGKPLLSYNHFDSYPENLGVEMVEFARDLSKMNIDEVRGAVGNIEIIDSNIAPSKALQEKYSALGFSDTSVSRGTLEDWYCLLRNVQGSEGLRQMVNGVLQHIEASNDFPKDSLFCEYAYIINLDTEEIEFYKGFQEKPQKGNRFGTKSDRGYYPCRMVGKCSIKDIPENWQEKFFPEN